MGKVIPMRRARFAIGELVQHRLFGYRGVVFDVDASFGLSEEWYDTVARSRPPKDKPWYQVLVHGTGSTTYVAERNLEADRSKAPVEHPLVERLFTRFENGRYIREQQ
jgi:heat shock protein HspQ